MNRTLLTILLTVFLILALASVGLSQIVRANPYHHIWIDEGDVSPDPYTHPPQILINSPSEETLFGAGIVSISLTVYVGESTTAKYPTLEKIYYKADWLPNATVLYDYNLIEPVNSIEPPKITEFSQTINLTGIPDGKHNVIFYAVEKGLYQTGQGPEGSGLNAISYAYYGVDFNITGVSSLCFTMDGTAPVVTVLELNNKIFTVPEVTLNFTTTEATSKMAYAIDGQESVLISGNTTLQGLSVGTYNVTVYAWDAAGNVGASETAVFTVKEEPESFLAMPVMVVSGAVITVACVGLVFYFRKR